MLFWKEVYIQEMCLRWWLRQVGVTLIDRKAPSKDALRLVADCLAAGEVVGLFPEGTRIDRGERGTYKSGGTRLAVETGAPVIPIAVTSARCWPRKALIKQAGFVDVSIGAPIAPDGLNPAELMAKVENWIESEMRVIAPDAYNEKIST